MNGERPGRAGLTVDLGQETGTVFPVDEQGADLTDKRLELGMVMRPTASVQAAPEGGFVKADDADPDMLACRHRFGRQLYGPV